MLVDTIDFHYFIPDSNTMTFARGHMYDAKLIGFIILAQFSSDQDEFRYDVEEIHVKRSDITLM